MFTITTSIENKDYPHGLTSSEAIEHYMRLYGNFESKLQKPDFYPSPERGDIFVLDFAKGTTGLKAYGAEKFMADLDSDVVGYAAPRVGHAAEAIASLCETYGKRGVFFAPASKQISAHQAVVTAYDNCEVRFARIAAMPALNSWIRKWADEFGAQALPFGLANVPEVTAGLVNVCRNHSAEYGEPTEIHCAVSTGTMIRALQIGWPNARAFGTAVARNMKDGEIGNADVEAYHKGFYKSSDVMPEFETTATYDAKAYASFLDLASPGAVFINVGADRQIEKRLELVPGWKGIPSAREWGDQEAFNRA